MKTNYRNQNTCATCKYRFPANYLLYCNEGDGLQKLVDCRFNKKTYFLLDEVEEDAYEVSSFGVCDDWEEQ